jgi:sugar O-acyltransferase (sialic acid O-acetyltransferase NeuD family)
MKSILLIGGGGHCRSCIDVVETENAYAIAGLVLPSGESSSSVFGYPVVGHDEDLPRLVADTPCALIAVGQLKSAAARMHLYELLKKSGAFLPVIVSPKAHVSSRAAVGEGTIVIHAAVVNAGASIGENCIVNTQALVEHDVLIEAHCHISTGARLNGGVVVRQGAFIGSGAVLREGIEIGEGAVIGAGQVVLKSVPVGALVGGRE